MIVIADKQERPVLILDDEPAIAEAYWPNEKIVPAEFREFVERPSLSLVSGGEYDGMFFTTLYDAPQGSDEWLLALMDVVRAFDFTWEDA